MGGRRSGESEAVSSKERRKPAMMKRRCRVTEPQMFFSRREYLHSNFSSPPFASPNFSKLTFADVFL
ncbi:hypothetical protein STEG23_004774 [Scotinomys teguina]